MVDDIPHNNINNSNDNDSENELDLYADTKHISLIKELHNNKFIFIKNYVDEKINENNKRYVSWLQRIYTQIQYTNNCHLKKICFKFKSVLLSYSQLFEAVKDNLFVCTNPECKSIIYLSQKHKEKLDEIKNIELIGNAYKYYYHLEYKKTRCPLCLKYKCIYCNSSSSLKSSLCCVRQHFMCCYYADIFEYLYPLAYSIYFPIIRVWFISFVANFLFFRDITKKCKLLETPQNMKRMANSGERIMKSVGMYGGCKNRIYHFFYNIFHIVGGIIWALAYIIFFESVLILFMLISFSLNKKKFFMKIMHCLYLFNCIPGLRGGSIQVE
jgi:hypothetical protein